MKKPLITKKRIIFILMLLATLAIFASTTAYYAAIPFGVLVIWTCISFLPSMLTGKKLVCEISGGSQGSKSNPISFRVTFKNRSLIPIFAAGTRVEIENVLSGEAIEENLNFALGPKGRRTLEISAKDSCCGAIKASISKASIGDPLGIRQADIVLRGSDIHYILPKPEEIEFKDEKFNSYNMESFKYSQSKRGNDPGEIFGIKEYMPGDSPKSIHWKLSSKLDEIVIRELGLPVENDIMIIFDNCLNPTRKMAQEEKTELIDKSITLFASISYSLLQRKIPHAIGWYGMAEGSFEADDIRDEEELWQSLRKTIACPMRENEQSSIYHFLESTVEKKYSHYIYVSCDNRDIERLAEYGAVSTIRPQS